MASSVRLHRLHCRRFAADTPNWSEGSVRSVAYNHAHGAMASWFGGAYVSGGRAVRAESRQPAGRFDRCCRFARCRIARGVAAGGETGRERMGRQQECPAANGHGGSCPQRRRRRRSGDGRVMQPVSVQPVLAQPVANGRTRANDTTRANASMPTGFRCLPGTRTHSNDSGPNAGAEIQPIEYRAVSTQADVYQPFVVVH